MQDILYMLMADGHVFEKKKKKKKDAQDVSKYKLDVKMSKSIE